MSIEGKKIIITGGATGYGYGDARALKAAGGEVWIVGRRLERLRKAAEELGVRFIQGDITRGEDWDRIMETVGEVDILVNNAGIAVKVEPLLSFSDEEIFRSINGNLTGAILGCRRVAEKMVARKSGLIINVTSVCSHYGWPGFACYTAAKAGLDMFSRALYTELRPHNVRVTVLTPSWGATEFGIAANLPPTEKELAAKMMSPDQMGELVRYICDFPEHLEFPEIMVQPLVQEIIPF
ncbi:SDR family oxidoreductase [Victivallis vadensis]|jgi:short-chain dehydrogenase/reductase SDR|uniref:SDR family oxidoreductase n=1 Tax=Victivallis vadensis TaxID=172901 RepID=A0A848AX04_9BACT|nr:SDR family oxidoreductase [Victivallis vadensis]NMD88055.1 SDR family oxidoreductase [Victivallis vadensis]